MFFRGGYAMHQGYVPPFAASHGCIRLPRGMAPIFRKCSCRHSGDRNRIVGIDERPRVVEACFALRAVLTFGEPRVKSLSTRKRVSDAGLTKEELQRYSRHLMMPEVTSEGQKRLKAARVLCIGAGGLGSPAALYLAAAGVGRLGIVDFDHVDLTNLQRQILHGTKDIGRSKLESARDRLRDINPDIEIQLHECRLSSENAENCR